MKKTIKYGDYNHTCIILRPGEILSIVPTLAKKPKYRLLPKEHLVG